MLPPNRSSEGNRLLNLGQFAEAKAEFESMLAGDAKDVKCLLGLARAQRALGELDDALATVNKVFAVKPDHLESKSLRGLLRVEKGDAAGVKDLEEAAKDRRSGPAEHINFGLYLCGKDDARAQKEFELALRADSRSGIAIMELGKIAERRGDNHSALTHFTKATQFATANDPEPFLAMARVQSALGAGQHAAMAALEAVQRAPESRRASVAATAFELCLSLRQAEAAVKVALQALELDPDNATYQSWMQEAQELARGGGAPKKATGSKELWAEAPTSSGTNKAVTAATLPPTANLVIPGDLQECMRKAQEALLLKSPPHCEDAHRLLEPILKHNPDEPRANILKGIALGLQKKYAEALPHAKKGLTTTIPTHRLEAEALVARLEMRLSQQAGGSSANP